MNRFFSKRTKTNRKCIWKQPKQTDLFQNEPKQTENDLKNFKSKKNFCGIKISCRSQSQSEIFMDCRKLCYLQSVKISR